MRAVVFHGPGDLRFEEIAVPTPAPGEVVLRIEAALTCGTDVKTLRRGHPVMIPRVPTVFGHEFAGTVSAVGAGVTRVREGDQLAAANSAPCGECALCLAGRSNLCEDLLFVNGAYGEHIALPARLVARNLVPIGPGLTAASAAFANVLVKARSMQLAPAMLAAWQMIFGTAPLLLLGFAVDGNPVRFHWTVSSVFCLLYLAVIGSALTFLLLYWLLPRLTVAQLQSISLITPPGAVMLGWLLGGETFPLSSLLGAALVLVGVWMIFRKASPPEPLIQEG